MIKKGLISFNWKSKKVMIKRLIKKLHDMLN